MRFFDLHEIRTKLVGACYRDAGKAKGWLQKLSLGAAAEEDLLIKPNELGPNAARRVGGIVTNLRALNTGAVARSPVDIDISNELELELAEMVVQEIGFGIIWHRPRLLIAIRSSSPFKMVKMCTGIEALLLRKEAFLCVFGEFSPGCRAAAV